MPPRNPECLYRLRLRRLQPMVYDLNTLGRQVRLIPRQRRRRRMSGRVAVPLLVDIHDHKALLLHRIVLCRHNGRINSLLARETDNKRRLNVVGLLDPVFNVPALVLNQIGVNLKILSRSHHKYNSLVASVQVSMPLPPRSPVSPPLAIDLVDL